MKKRLLILSLLILLLSNLFIQNTYADNTVYTASKVDLYWVNPSGGGGVNTISTWQPGGRSSMWALGNSNIQGITGVVIWPDMIGTRTFSPYQHLRVSFDIQLFSNVASATAPIVGCPSRTEFLTDFVIHSCVVTPSTVPYSWKPDSVSNTDSLISQYWGYHYEIDVVYDRSYESPNMDGRVGLVGPTWISFNAPTFSYFVISRPSVYIYDDADYRNTQSIIDAIDESNGAAAEMNDKDDQDRANIESQQDSTSSDADSAQSDSESTGTTLLAGFSAFNSAVSSANPSNCNIDFNIMGYIQGGTVDLCHLNLPPQLQVIGSITMIVFVVPLSVITAKRFISLMRSFQS